MPMGGNAIVLLYTETQRQFITDEMLTPASSNSMQLNTALALNLMK